MSKKKRILKETGPSYDQKLVCSDNPRQNIWNKAKSSKFEKEEKSLIPTFGYIFTAINRV